MWWNKTTEMKYKERVKRALIDSIIVAYQTLGHNKI